MLAMLDELSKMLSFRQKADLLSLEEYKFENRPSFSSWKTLLPVNFDTLNSTNDV